MPVLLSGLLGECPVARHWKCGQPRCRRWNKEPRHCNVSPLDLVLSVDPDRHALRWVQTLHRFLVEAVQDHVCARLQHAVPNMKRRANQPRRGLVQLELPDCKDASGVGRRRGRALRVRASGCDAVARRGAVAREHAVEQIPRLASTPPRRPCRVSPAIPRADQWGSGGGPCPRPFANSIRRGVLQRRAGHALLGRTLRICER